VVGRNTQGVRIIRLKDNENLVSLARIAEPEEDELAEDESGASAEASAEE
jgi:DNA gyrase subunit A